MLVLLLWRAGIVPHYSESDSITSFELEWGELEASHVGTVIVGDMNVHHVQCLTYSIHTTPADIALRTWAAEHGLRQLVKKPTRGSNLLDLVLTDMPNFVHS